VTFTLIADAGPDAGLGHLSRTGAVAWALRARGAETRCFAWGAEKPLERDAIRWEPLSVSEPPPRGDVVVLDSYRADPAVAEELVRDCRLVLMHDSGEVPAETAVVVSTVGETGEDGPLRLVGLRYACLRPGFWGLPERAGSARVRRVLVATGGGGLAGAGLELAQAARDALPEADVALVRGPYADGTPVAGVTVVESPPSLLGELLAADLVLTAGGQTLLEAAATGTPAIALALVDNQQSQAEALAAGGGALLAESTDSASQALTELAADADRRAELARRGQELVDGFGALRVGFHVWRLAESDAGEIE
jgi:spore coat polysaccharide biosynthesis predicted glycosyltransferase SpsG